jgi:NAD(P)-dependent dehydrogenase (short-subunit alcohol dehydrogenase family)
MGYLDGRVAIVTGAGRLRGIGRATAVALASEGADVVVTGTGRDPASYPAFLLAKRIVPIMVGQKWGRIINLSSVAGKRASPNTAAYNVANFGVQGFTQSLAMELARHGITVNAVCLGTIDTARMDVLGRGEGLAGRARTDPDGPCRQRRGSRRPHRLSLLPGRRVHDGPVDQHRRRRRDAVISGAPRVDV